MRIQSTPQNIKYAQPMKMIGGCPHGNPGGSCPLCNTMGGGGGSAVKPKPTPKELGLKTWADLLPVWYAMQAAKFRKESEARLDKLIEMRKAIEKTQIYQAITRFLDTEIKPLVKMLAKNILMPLGKAVDTVMQKLNNLVNSIYDGIKTQLVQQMQKFGGLMAEKMAQLTERLKQSMEIFKNAMANFISDIKQKEKAVREYLIAEANKFKKRLLSFIEDINSSLEQRDDRKKFIDPYEEVENV